MTRGRPNDPLRASEAHGQWQAQTAELKTALTSLQAAVKNLTGSPSATAVGGRGHRARPDRGCDDVPMGYGFLKALLVIVAATLAVGCGGDPRPPAHRDSPAPAHQDSPTPSYRTLSKVEACRQLRGSLSRNQGVPDIPTLRLIADHVTAPRMAAEARTAVRDIGHTGIAPLPLALLRDDCARAGVQIP